jgi:hypothetical protein
MKGVYLMKNADILDMLNNIEILLEREEYQQIIDYIQRKKAEIKSDNDPSSQYIDKLIDELK